jgi:hypothetical protein
MKLERDNFGRWVVRDQGATFYLDAIGNVMMRYTTDWTDKRGKVWHTPHHRRITGPRAERVRAQLTTHRALSESIAGESSKPE